MKGKVAQLCLFVTPFSGPEYRSGKPIPSPGDLPDLGIEPGSPALQVDSLPAELSGKPIEITLMINDGVSIQLKNLIRPLKSHTMGNHLFKMWVKRQKSFKMSFINFMSNKIVRKTTMNGHFIYLTYYLNMCILRKWGTCYNSIKSCNLLKLGKKLRCISTKSGTPSNLVYDINKLF